MQKAFLCCVNLSELFCSVPLGPNLAPFDLQGVLMKSISSQSAGLFDVSTVQHQRNKYF